MINGGCELSIVAPAYQEAAHLDASLRVIRDQVAKLTSSFELIVVDDGSTDRTWDIVAGLHAEDERIRGIRLSRNFGKEYAIAAGLDDSRGQATLLMDADLQHPPAMIQTFYQIWKSGSAQVIEGVKVRRRDEPMFRRILSHTFNYIATRFTGIDFENSTDFKLLDRQALDAWKALPERRCYFRGMSAWVGFTRVQVDFAVAPRSNGESRWSLRQLLRLGWTALTAYSGMPLRFIHLCAVFFLLFSALLTWRALYLKFKGEASSGFTTVIIVELLIGGLLLLCLGIVAEYLAAMYDEIKRRPRYLVRERIS